MRVPTKGIVRLPVLNLYFLADAESFASDGIQGIEHWTCESVDGELKHPPLPLWGSAWQFETPGQDQRVCE